MSAVCKRPSGLQHESSTARVQGHNPTARPSRSTRLSAGSVVAALMFQQRRQTDSPLMSIAKQKNQKDALLKGTGQKDPFLGCRL